MQTCSCWSAAICATHSRHQSSHCACHLSPSGTFGALFTSHGVVRSIPRARRGPGDDGGDLHGGACPFEPRSRRDARDLAGLFQKRPRTDADPSFSLPRSPRQTTIMACQYDGGVVLGADSRTSTGTYVANRASDKITQVTDNVWMCRSGSVRRALLFVSRQISRGNAHPALAPGRP